ncbi:MAG: amidohydrolase family protein [Bacteroidales bacterium]|nr:amidohydrolase family protein [Bacteroidales bacterium]
MNRRDFLKTSVLGAAALGFTGMTGCKVSTRHSFDAIIKNGVIHAGDGKAPIQGDIAIRDGKIAAIGKDLGTNAGTVIDAKGLVVSPGFIDIHTHTDTNLFDAPKGDSRIYQGITSEVGGNCGYCPFVYSDEAWEGRKDRPRHGGPAWRDIDGFYQRLTENKIGINYSSLVGHGDVREAVVGPYNVKTSEEDLKKMGEILDRQLGMGAIGLSYGLEYAPGCYCDTREMVEMNKVVKKHNALYTIHMRNEDDHVLEAMDEAIEAARQSGARLEISHLKAQNPANFDKIDEMLGKIDKARAEGIDIAFDRYPYTAFSTGFTSFIPIELRDGTSEDIYRRLNDKAACEKIKKYAYSRLERFGGPQQVVVAGCNDPANAVYAGKNLAECCKISGMNEWEMIRYLLISEKLEVNQATFAMKEENLKKIYAHPLSMPASDGSVYSPEGPLGKELPHPRSYGTFPRFFEKFVREDKVLDLPTAIWKCTGLPASRIKFKERGLLIPGYAADITVFDPETIADRSTYAQPHQFPAGIAHVFVNGVHTIKEGAHTGALSGIILDNSQLSR